MIFFDVHDLLRCYEDILLLEFAINQHLLRQRETDRLCAAWFGAKDPN